MSKKHSKNVLGEVDISCEERSKMARHLREQGKKIVGYFCCLIPVEFLSALDLVPYRIHGNIHEPITMADAHLENIMCPFARSCFDLAIKEEYEFLDGLVVPHSCDTIQRIYDIWVACRKPEFCHFINVPHMVDASSHAFFRKELEMFVQSLERYTGQQLSLDKLNNSIQLHNRKRSLLRQLYGLRKENPPLISGVEVMKLLIAGMVMPIEEFNDIVLSAIEEVKGRHRKGRNNQARLLLYGSEVDDIDIIQCVEDCGANIVVDDICTGTRSFWEDVDTSIDPWEALTKRYLEGTHCPRTYIPQGMSRHDDLESRFGYLRHFIEEFNVSGAILYIMKFCDTHELDAPDVREYLHTQGIETLYLESDYTASSRAQLQTRVEAFLEMIR
ncbi:2-hydroxyacyl-CoA dehydratase subunit D [Chloroflexota bacterium]